MSDRDIYWAVHSAIHGGMSVKVFLQKVREAWAEVTYEKQRHDELELRERAS